MSTRPLAVVAGGSGFLGRAISAAFEDDGYEIRHIGRTGPVRWDDPDGIARALDGADVLVNLAGKSVNCRYTDRNRDEILRSRVTTTRALREAITTSDHPVRVWLNASTATIYRHETEQANTETTGVIGEGFSVDVARDWEHELFDGELPRTRRVALRIAIVLGDGPATRALVTLARIGLGGPQYDGWWFPHNRYRGIGSDPSGNGRARGHRAGGRQRFSWVHVDDVVGAVRFLRDRDDISGPVNVVSPQSTDNRGLMRALRRTVHAPIGLPALRWMLEPAMWVLRTEPELVLKSRWVSPEVLTMAGYRFRHPELEEALLDVVRATAGPRRHRGGR
ncbi:NAD dependent epimerase/dehydratase family enzyme [Microbacterium sp. SORGH_AS 888]|nr:NAD dependent epimerase/dehydratase family enzyme [Microbacterium sp. SORGH_AS_0888]